MPRAFRAIVVDSPRPLRERLHPFGGEAQFGAGHDSLVGRVAESGKQVCVLDAWDDPEYRDKDASVRSLCGIPLRAGGETVGVLSLGRAMVAPFADGTLTTDFAYHLLIKRSGATTAARTFVAWLKQEVRAAAEAGVDDL